METKQELLLQSHSSADPEPSQKSTLAPMMDYPVPEQRNHFSEFITTPSNIDLPSLLRGPEVEQSLVCLTGGQMYNPKVTTFQTPEDLHSLVEKDQQGLSTWLSPSDFPSCSYSPKIQMPTKHLPGQIPRKVEVERRKREFLKLDVNELLMDYGIDSDRLIQRMQSKKDSVCNFYPIELFDDEEFDCRTPEDWLLLGYEAGSSDQKPVPGKAFLPNEDNGKKAKDVPYSWHSVGVLDYHPSKKLYLVHKADSQGRVRDSSGNLIVNIDKKLGARRLQPGQYWVPRIRLLFSAEDPRVFAQRLLSAQRLQQSVEDNLRYHKSVERMPKHEETPSMDPEDLCRITNLAFSSNKLPSEDEYVPHLEIEVKAEYDRAMKRMNFNKAVLANPEKFPNIIVPEREAECIPQRGCVTLPDYPYEDNRSAFISNSLLTQAEVITALSTVQNECSKAVSTSLFNFNINKPLRLEEFERIQSRTYTQVEQFLREAWVEQLCDGIYLILQGVTAGWFCLTQSWWEVYQMSKMRRVMELVRFCMEDSLRFLVQNSLLNLVQLLLDASDSVLQCPEDMTWGNDLINSPYQPKKNPLFMVHLVLDKSGVHYSTPVEAFEVSVVKLFDEGIVATHNVPQVEKFVIKNITITGTPLLGTVGLLEPMVVSLREKIRLAIRSATYPLKAYAREYEKYLDLHNTDIEPYLRSHCKAEMTAKEVNDDLLKCLQEQQLLESSLPSTIVIGPFMVSVETVRQTLSKKWKSLANALLDQLVEMLRRQLDDACDEYRAITKQLYEKCNTIEEIMEHREWMKVIPERLQAHEGIISKVMENYELLDELLYVLSKEDFSKKWAALAWPQKLLGQSEAVLVMHQQEEDFFQKAHLEHQIAFTERVEGLQMAVAGLSNHIDVDRAHEVANEVRRIGKQLHEAQEYADLLNFRDRLFGMPVTDYNTLEQLRKDIVPFRDLWLTASDWLRWHKTWMNDPLSNLDPDLMESSVQKSSKIIENSIEIFQDVHGCKDVALNIQKRIEDFKPLIPLIQVLRHKAMRSQHWQMLSERIGKTVQPKGTNNVIHYIEMGLLNHLEEMTQVAKLASEQLALGQEMEEPEQSQTPDVEVLTPRKRRGTYTG